EHQQRQSDQHDRPEFGDPSPLPHTEAPSRRLDSMAADACGPAKPPQMQRKPALLAMEGPRPAQACFLGHFPQSRWQDGTQRPANPLRRSDCDESYEAASGVAGAARVLSGYKDKHLSRI